MLAIYETLLTGMEFWEYHNGDDSSQNQRLFKLVACPNLSYTDSNLGMTLGNDWSRDTQQGRSYI